MHVSKSFCSSVFLSDRENCPKPVHMNMEFTEETCILVNQGWLYQCIER